MLGKLAAHEGAERDDAEAGGARVLQHVVQQCLGNAVACHGLGDAGMIGADRPRAMMAEGQLGLGIKAGQAGDVSPAPFAVFLGEFEFGHAVSPSSSLASQAAAICAS